MRSQARVLGLDFGDTVRIHWYMRSVKRLGAA